MKNRAFDYDLQRYPNWIDPKEVTPYPRNAKLHPPEQIATIVNSITRFGWQQDCVLTADNVLVVGHGRRLAAIEIGCKMPFHRVGKNADELTDAEIDALRLADNKVAESGWDFEALEAELAELELEFDMTEFGFDDIQTDSVEPAEAADDDFDVDASVEPRAKLGEIYQLGQHRLMCGDSTDAAAWARLMDGEKADMVFTDPPYGVAIGDKNAMLNAHARTKSRAIEENIMNDTLSEGELYDMLKAAFINVRENCADDAVYFVTSPQGGSLGLMMMMMMRDAGLEVRHVLMWRKNCPTFSLGRLDYDYQHEPIFYTWVNKHHNYRNGEYRSTVWDYDKPRKCNLHPTMKPVELVANAIKDGSRAGDIVLDAFGGSGTTLIAAEQLGRKCRMMEIDPHYVDVILTRWEQLTGKKAVLLDA